MTQQLTYGRDGVVQFDVSNETLLADCGAPHADSIADVSTAVAAAMADPLEFPSLDRATVPGDVVAIVLDDELPQVPAVVAGIVRGLMHAGVEAEHIRLVQTRLAAELESVDPRADLTAELRGQVVRVIHNPASREELSFLAANRSGDAVYLNRAICDADLVIPVGCIRQGAWDPQRGAFGGLFPAFSDQGAQQQMRQLMRLAEAARSPSLQTVTDEIGWLLGSMMTVQVVPGGDDGLLDVLCGEVQAVMDRGRALYEAAWTMIVPGGADLVIAAISGDARQQTWANVARTLAAARQVVSATGSIALCTELAAQPGPGVKSLIEIADPYDARAELEQSQASDSAIAEELSLALEQGSVFLLSQLEEDLVEAIGMVPLEDDEQVARLTSRFQSCILLGHAQYANPRVEELS